MIPHFRIKVLIICNNLHSLINETCILERMNIIFVKYDATLIDINTNCKMFL